MSVVLRAPGPHVNAPECWCHPLVITPHGCFQLWDGRPTKIEAIQIVAYPGALNHQDPLGAALRCVPGVFRWRAKETI